MRSGINQKIHFHPLTSSPGILVLERVCSDSGSGGINDDNASSLTCIPKLQYIRQLSSFHPYFTAEGTETQRLVRCQAYIFTNGCGGVEM